MWKAARVLITFACVFSLAVPAPLLAESVDDEFTQISPQHSPGSGEYVHGQGYGKMLMRLMLFGAIPQQGVHYVPEGTDLLFAILYAGGYGEQTSLNNITIRRRGLNEIIHVDLEDIIAEAQAVPKLKDGDVVNVPHNWRQGYQQFMFFAGIFSSVTGLLISLSLIAR